MELTSALALLLSILAFASKTTTGAPSARENDKRAGGLRGEERIANAPLPADDWKLPASSEGVARVLSLENADSTSFSKGYDVLSPSDDLARMELLGDLALMDEAEIYNLTSFEEDLVPFGGPFGDLSLYDTNLTSAQNATEDSSGRHLDIANNVCSPSYAAYTYRSTSTMVNFATGRVLDSNGAKQVYTLGGNGGDYQKWRLYYSDCFKTYVLMNQATEKVLDSDGSGSVYTNGYNGGNFQKWKPYHAGDGRVFLQNVATDRVLDSSASGNVYTLGYNGGNFQKWSI